MKTMPCKQFQSTESGNDTLCCSRSQNSIRNMCIDEIQSTCHCPSTAPYGAPGMGPQLPTLTNHGEGWQGHTPAPAPWCCGWDPLLSQLGLWGLCPHVLPVPQQDAASPAWAGTGHSWAQTPWGCSGQGDLWEEEVHGAQGTAGTLLIQQTSPPPAAPSHSRGVC